MTHRAAFCIRITHSAFYYSPRFIFRNDDEQLKFYGGVATSGAGSTHLLFDQISGHRAAPTLI